MMTSSKYHTPALLEECLDGLNIQPGGTYVDVTFGGGGHSRAILDRLTDGRLIAFDRDADALANVPEDKRLTLVHSEFIHITNFLRYLKAIPVDGILADLGISSHQIDQGDRGFSFRFDSTLDMRMDRQQERTAADILNNTSEADLQIIFSQYGEIPNSKTLARAVVRHRNMSPIETTSQLAAICQEVLPAKENLKKYMSPIFQALRIEVNNELVGLESLLIQSLEVLKPGGRLAIITYQSLEDRPVKNFFQTGNFEGKEEKNIFGKANAPWKIINKKPIIPGTEEVESNPRVRSAKLRIGEKI